MGSISQRIYHFFAWPISSQPSRSDIHV
jgi:hypothetical protein